MLNPRFDTLFVASSAFSETRAFRSNRADLAKMHERNCCATRAQFSTTWAQIPATERNFKKMYLLYVLGSRAFTPAERNLFVTHICVSIGPRGCLDV